MPKLPKNTHKKSKCPLLTVINNAGLKETLPLYPIDERAIKIIHEDSSPEKEIKIAKFEKETWLPERPMVILVQKAEK